MLRLKMHGATFSNTVKNTYGAVRRDDRSVIRLFPSREILAFMNHGQIVRHAGIKSGFSKPSADWTTAIQARKDKKPVFSMRELADSPDLRKS
jgi:hypothetical protein